MNESLVLSYRCSVVGLPRTSALSIQQSARSTGLCGTVLSFRPRRGIFAPSGGIPAFLQSRRRQQTTESAFALRVVRVKPTNPKFAGDVALSIGPLWHRKRARLQPCVTGKNKPGLSPEFAQRTQVRERSERNEGPRLGCCSCHSDRGATTGTSFRASAASRGIPITVQSSHHRLPQSTTGNRFAFPIPNP